MSITRNISFPDDIYLEVKGRSEDMPGGGNFSAIAVHYMRLGMKSEQDALKAPRTPQVASEPPKDSKTSDTTS